VSFAIPTTKSVAASAGNRDGKQMMMQIKQQSNSHRGVGLNEVIYVFVDQLERTCGWILK
jgi:hypothetical protein